MESQVEFTENYERSIWARKILSCTRAFMIA